MDLRLEKECGKSIKPKETGSLILINTQQDLKRKDKLPMLGINEG